MHAFEKSNQTESGVGKTRSEEGCENEEQKRKRKRRREQKTTENDPTT